ncbi:putative beta-carotene 3-hydroxylase [Helianthus annuus]|uniref:beta-carotene 3-hydroxylase n=1 Tax=Helianthus annuus TaxID=4232 RepID=A0A251SCQ8_HELAN|nr:beta-carotene hydroxylase 2, chloroplastic [Helianthus annuus]KAF5766804.1 putative beta-carotene 3-hydroxylase [Helianthus annuus]KAJ0453138.1 putative beta-carotene 3-hydroxylase [Helianthus annuus]KAJ0458276.1 putative beta-carotene 3-hydroxylase [Helianthus annuus]KAJ0475055.1 putative beta-carotene 3-hydroxylase [Helianthus annuus]KAJ0650610.1 putative beta-carotene 3-hydroxylase [Helianthus annuus]
MAATYAVSCSSRPFCLHRFGQKSASTTTQLPFSYRNFDPLVRSRRTPTLTICFVRADQKFDALENNSSNSTSSTGTSSSTTNNNNSPGPGGQGQGQDSSPPELIIPVLNRNSSAVEEKMKRKKSERFTYLVAAIMSTFGITSLAVMAVYYRFSWQMEGGEIPYVEMFGTFALSVGAAVGMEYWARWAHEALWHASLWHMHESHHKPREGPFELNDVFAIINAVPAIALLNYGFFHKGIVPGLCFGAGLGITVFGMAYMFVHDGLVHKRFQVGPIANVPYLRRVAAAHQLHHTEKFNGVPYGLFLGPKELEEVGGMEELEKEIQRRIKLYNNK